MHRSFDGLAGEVRRLTPPPVWELRVHAPKTSGGGGTGHPQGPRAQQYRGAAVKAPADRAAGVIEESACEALMRLFYEAAGDVKGGDGLFHSSG